MPCLRLSVKERAKESVYEDLEQMLLDHYRTNGLRSLARIEGALQHLRGFFSRALAMEVLPDRILRYIAYRQEQKAANATINRELAALRRMFILGERSEKVVRRPHIALLQELNARKGFLEPDVFRAVVAAPPDDLKPLIEAAYLTGWRLRSELLTRQWEHVDFKAGWLRLKPGETKNGEGRQSRSSLLSEASWRRRRTRLTALPAKPAISFPGSSSVGMVSRSRIFTAHGTRRAGRQVLQVSSPMTDAGQP